MLKHSILVSVITIIIAVALSANAVATNNDIDLGNYVGVYENPDNTCRVLFSRKSGSPAADVLVVQMPNGQKYELAQGSSTVFFMANFVDIKFNFSLDETGQAVSYSVLGTKNLILPFKRISTTIPQFSTITIDTEIMEQYTGYYRGDEGTVFRVFIEDGTLYIDSPQIDYKKIIPVSRTTFFSPDTFYSYIFEKNDNGDVDRVHGSIASNTTSYEKIDKEIEERTIDSVDKAVLKSYAGTYSGKLGCYLLFSTDGKHLFLPDRRMKDIELFPESESTFFRLSDDVRFTFVKDADGSVTSVIRRSSDSVADFVRSDVSRDGSPIPENPVIRVVVDGYAGEQSLSWTEGPSWIRDRLFFSDQVAGLVMWRDGMCKALNTSAISFGTTALANGNLVVCDRSDSTLKEISPEGVFVRTLADGYDGEPFAGNPNDFTTDLKGGIYFTVNAYETDRNSNVVFYITPLGNLLRVTEYNEFPFPNGIVLSADGSKLFLSGSMKSIYVFDVNEDGTLFNKRVFAEMSFLENQFGSRNPVIRADGMEIDTEGNLYVTTITVGLQIFNKEGQLIDIVPVNCTNLTFGGPDLSTLYITSKANVLSLETKAKGYQYPLKYGQ